MARLEYDRLDKDPDIYLMESAINHYYTVVDLLQVHKKTGTYSRGKHSTLSKHSYYTGFKADVIGYTDELCPHTKDAGEYVRTSLFI